MGNGLKSYITLYSLGQGYKHAYNLSSILDGNIQDVLDKLQMAENAERLKENNL